MSIQTEPLDLSKSSQTCNIDILNTVAEINKQLLQIYRNQFNADILHKINEGKKLELNGKIVRNILPCQVCWKSFDRPSLLKRHMRTHTGEKPHICSVCKKGFSTSSSLNTHRRIHTGEKPHKCSECGKCFTASSNLYYHRMTHTKNKPHKCHLCPRSFPTPGDLRAHGPAHGGAWPYTCHICSRGFAKQTNLKHHLRLHEDPTDPQGDVSTKQDIRITNLLQTLRQNMI